MRSLFVGALLAASLAPAGAGAQTSSLTEAQALAQLTPENPRVRAINAPIDIARADVLAAGRWPNPRGTYNRESVAGVTEHITTVAQVFPITGRRPLEVSAAAAMVDATSGRAGDQLRRLRTDLRLAFAELVAAQDRERELAATRDRLQELAGVLSKREAAGDAAGFDRLRAEREVLEADVERAGAAVDRARAQALLAGFLMPAGSPAITAVAGNVPRAMLPAVDELMARAEETRGEISALRREIDAAAFAERAAGRRAIPEPEVVAGTKSSNVGSGDVGGVVAVHVAIPLFDRGRPEQALARARRSQAEVQLDALRAILRSQIAAWRNVVLERRDAADRYRAAALKTAMELERIAQVSYDAGERGILELLDAFRSSASARVRQSALDFAVRQAELELEFVSGWEIP
ncbi:MAG TPA: TolC family protein [Vicinamibacterales bacterium]|nr:TolC family protein [Vicinamibacterales bacterium]